MSVLETTAQPATGQVVPATTETVLATVKIPGFPPEGQGIFLQGNIAFTAGGTTGACTLRIRQTGLAGAVVGNPVALPVTVSVVNNLNVSAFDPAPLQPDSTYVLTASFATAGATLTQTTLNAAVQMANN